MRVSGWVDAGVGLGALSFGVFFGQFDEVLEAEGLGLEKRQGVGAAEGVTVVLDQPEVVFLAEDEDGGEIEGIAQGVGHHDGLGFARDKSLLKMGQVSIAREGIGVQKNRDGPVLDNGGNGSGKTSGDGDDFIARADTLVRGELVGGEGTEGNQIGGGTGIGEEGVFDAEEIGQFPLKRFSFGTQGEPKIQGGGDGGFHFVLGEDPPRVGDRLSGSESSMIRIIAGALTGVGETAVFAGETEDFGFEVSRQHGSSRREEFKFKGDLGKF